MNKPDAIALPTAYHWVEEQEDWCYTWQHPDAAHPQLLLFYWKRQHCS